MRRALLAALLLLLACLAPLQSALACSAAACISAGPRLASISSSRGPLLNALLNTLGGGSINLSAADWNTIAAGDLSLLKTLNALQASTNASTPAAALTANATVAQVVAAAATAAQQDNQTALAAALGNLQPQLVLPGTVRLGDLLSIQGLLGSTRINALSLVTGMVQLYNKQNVASTPQAIALSGTALGLAGVLNSVTLQAQVIEAPVYVCGPVGSGFHTAAIRVKLHLDLVSIALNLGVLNTSASIGQLDLYLEIGRADGIISVVDAIANTLKVQVTPGVAGLYLGSIADNVFFNRSRALVAGDVTPGNVGTLSLLGSTVAIRAKASTLGQAPASTELSFSGAGLQTRTAYSTSGTVLMGLLVDNLQLSLSPSGVLDGLLSALSPVLTATLRPLLASLLGSLVDPLLEMLGLRVGEVDVTSGGTVLSCSISGSVYRDSNHNARQDGGETGTGLPLYAKLVPSTTPTVASVVVAVDSGSGVFSFPSVLPASYSIVISSDSTPGQVAAAVPAGWLATESPTMKRSVTVSNADASAQRFGLYPGSMLTGTVFKDNGVGSGGVANNGVKDGSESAIQASVVTLSDSAGTTIYDSTTTDANGAYVLWLPASTDGMVLKVTQPADATVWLSVSGSAGSTGGSYALASDSVVFTHASGSSYSGVNFGDVPVNRLDSDGQLMVAPGAIVLFPHVFQAGSAGQLSLTATGTDPAVTGWTVLLLRDTGCDGQPDSSDPVIGSAITLAAGDKLCLLVKVTAPAGAATGTRLPLLLSAAFSYANAGLSATLQRQDLATVGIGSGLQLLKTVNRTSATSGELITYTISFNNLGAGAISALKISDATPAHTMLSSAACGSLPAGLSCSVTAQPAVGASGSLEWSLSGTLLSGASGSVTVTVKLN